MERAELQKQNVATVVFTQPHRSVRCRNRVRAIRPQYGILGVHAEGDCLDESRQFARDAEKRETNSETRQSP